MRIELFCDNCENSTEFEKVRVIEEYDSKSGDFKLTIDDTVYIRCKICGNINPIEVEKEDKE